jgi:hypothetical protein
VASHSIRAHRPQSFEHPSYPARLRELINLRHRSLLRGCILVFGSFGLSIPLSGFPNSRPNPFIGIFAVLACLGTIDTLRCIQRRWNLYHAGVILCIYADLMALGMIVFFLVYPYANR